MSDYTYTQISDQRKRLISPHYNSVMDVNPIGVPSGDITNIRIYQTEYDSDSSFILDSEQADIYMTSINFDKDLFKTLTETVGIDADVALMLSLS